MKKADNSNIVFCIYGFVRDMRKHDINMDDVKKFIYVPTIRYEDKDVKVSNEELTKHFGKNSVIVSYEYDAKFFNEEVKKLDIPKYNKNFQQPQRILSFFNHIRKSVELFETTDKDSDDDTIVFLFRGDIGIKLCNVEKAKELLVDNDIIVEKFTGGGLRDLFFAFKKKNIHIFKSMYESYKKYVVDHYKNPGPETVDKVNPEPIIKFHFKKMNAKVIANPVMHYRWGHICSPYCGHNKDNTKILGDD